MFSKNEAYAYFIAMFLLLVCIFVEGYAFVDFISEGRDALGIVFLLLATYFGTVFGRGITLIPTMWESMKE